jgi:hypothetical protein
MTGDIEAYLLFKAEEAARVETPNLAANWEVDQADSHTVQQ